MTRSRPTLATLASVFLLSLWSPALAQSAPAGGAEEVWTGSYDCPGGQGPTGLTLRLDRRDPGNVSALFHFFPLPENAAPKEGCFTMTGSFDPATGSVHLNEGPWILHPENYIQVPLEGIINGGSFTGRLLDPRCAGFRLTRTTGTLPAAAACAGATISHLPRSRRFGLAAAR